MITKYEIITEIIDTKSPFYDDRAGIFYIPCTDSFRYFIECKRFNEIYKEYEYFILVGNKRFDKKCKLCHTDNYGRLQIKLSEDFKHYFTYKHNARTNVAVEIAETCDDYRAYKLLI